MHVQYYGMSKGAYFGSAHRPHYKLADALLIFLTTTRLRYHEKPRSRLACSTVASCVSDLWSLHSRFGGVGTKRAELSGSSFGPVVVSRSYDHFIGTTWVDGSCLL